MKLQEVARVTLQTEMDLIIAHKRSMKLAELAGLSLPAQTTFATAVSEVSRSTIEYGKNGCLVLCFSNSAPSKCIVARILDREKPARQNQGLEYAKRLVNKFNVTSNDEETAIELYFNVPPAFKTDLQKMDEWKHMFRNEPSISPYEEIKRKNEQLQELSQRLQESEGQYKTLTNALPIIIFSLSPKGELIFANEWLRRLTGYSISQLNSNRWKGSVHPEDYNTFSLLLKADVASGASTIKAQCRLKHKEEDDWYWHLVSVSPLHDEKGGLLYWIGYMVDINAQKLVEDTLKDNQELKQVQLQLQQNQIALEENIADLNRSNLELQQFAYVASHDLQEPIRKIGYYSDFLNGRYANTLDEKGREYLSSMTEASARMRSLVHDLLEYSQVEKKVLEFTHINLNNVVKDVLHDIDVMIKEKNATVNAAYMPFIDADEGMMRQLFENLLTNSLKYSKEDVQPLITISNRQNGHMLEIHVTDNGIGFDEKYVPQMFMLFQRLHSSQKYKGTGLGLAICQKITRLHNGTITAASKEHEGATFVISLPFKQQ
jgi:PAS domain S-box-containing protein